MSNWIFLSYELDSSTPMYGDGDRFKNDHLKQITKGDTANLSHWSFTNHIGTHIDVPFHFIQEGKTLSDYTPEFWIIRNTSLIDLTPIDPGEILNTKSLLPYFIPDDIELLLLKTGFCQHRYNETYWKYGPIILPDIAEYLRKNCPQLKLLGLDTISVSSYSERETGRKVHRAFLSGEQPILLIEDMDLSCVNANTSFEQVIVSPLRVNKADGSPCTVFADITK